MRVLVLCVHAQVREFLHVHRRVFYFVLYVGALYGQHKQQITNISAHTSNQGSTGEFLRGMVKKSKAFALMSEMEGREYDQV